MTAAAASQIIICDDEPHLREMVAEYLEQRGFAVRKAANGEDLLKLVERSAPDLVLLDISMPGMDGLTTLRRLRTTDKVPVIMLTAAAETVDRIVGLEMGADDYLGKPVDLRELEARVKSVLRRSDKHADADDKVPDQKVSFGKCTLDLSKATLFDHSGEEVAITAMEFSLLKVFATNPGQVLNRDQLLERAHDRSWDPYDRSIDLRISRLRKKIESNPGKPEVIRTVRGLGYIFG
ncbi:MAG: response regulator [Pseudomonadota bacterium]